MTTEKYMDYTKEINEIKEKLEEMKVQNQEEDTENQEEDTENQEEDTEEDKVETFRDMKIIYERYGFLLKFGFHNLLLYLKIRGCIRECDAEEFSNSDSEFLKQKVELQKLLLKDLLPSDDDFTNLVLKAFRLYFWKQIGLFN